MLNHSLVPVGSTGYDIPYSARFNDDDSASLTRTPASAGDRKTWTFSCWVKKGNHGINEILFTAADTDKVPQTIFNFDSGDRLSFYDSTTGAEVTTSSVYRDSAAYYHILLEVDTTQATAADRINIYVNGVEASYGTEIYPSQNAEFSVNDSSWEHEIGGRPNNTIYFDGYLAEVNFVDGQALTPADFGETDEDYGHWKAKKYTGTYGTNGFYLDFLGNSEPVITDSSGNYTPSIAGGTTHSTDKAKFGATSIKAGNSNDNLTIPNSSTVAPNGSNSITYECWLWWDGSSAPNLAFGVQSDWYQPFWFLNSSGNLGWGNQSNGGSSLYYHYSSNSCTASAWNHLMVTISNKTVTHYINGVSGGSHTYSTGTWSPAGTNLQFFRNANGNYFDELRVSNNIRYSSNFTPATSPYTSDANTKLLIHSDFDANTSLGADNSPNNNHWTPNNLAATDQMLDTPTNNFATFNATGVPRGTLSEGNLQEVYTGSTGVSNNATRGTMGVSSGKYYWEYYYKSAPSNRAIILGVVRTDESIAESSNTMNAWWYSGYQGYKGKTGGVYLAYGDAMATGDIIGVALDANTGTIWFSVDGVWQNSATTTEIANGTTTNSAFTGQDFGEVTPATINGGDNQSHTYVANFGQDSSFAGNKTAQGNADDNGYGDFYYTPPTGFLALCTQNLPEPTVVPSEHFNTVTYNGNGTASRSITGVGFQPDFTWIKNRGLGNHHQLHDNVRGATTGMLSSNSTATEDSGYPLTSFDTDGYTTKSGAQDGTNNSGYTFVAWNWKANGTGVSNTNGSITSTVSANVDAGFSIVSYTGNGTTGSTIGHGLSQTPELQIIARRDSTNYWMVTHKDVAAGSIMHLYSTLAAYGTSNAVTLGATVWTESGGGGYSNVNGGTYLAYNFHSVEGYSKVGTYTGNGSTDGTFVHCGFRPAYVMIKPTASSSHHWWIHDTARNPINASTKQLRANSSAAEYDDATYTALDIVSNGFKWRTSEAQVNASSNFIYIAFAEHPFKYTNAR